jgi:hypothetical protein
MGGPQAASVLSTVKNDQMEKQTGKPMSKEEIDAFEKRLLDKYEQEGSPYFATARLWDDGVIQIEDTRRVLGQVLRVVSKDCHPLIDGNTYGVFRTWVSSGLPELGDDTGGKSDNLEYFLVWYKIKMIRFCISTRYFFEKNIRHEKEKVGMKQDRAAWIWI